MMFYLLVWASEVGGAMWLLSHVLYMSMSLIRWSHTYSPSRWSIEWLFKVDFKFAIFASSWNYLRLLPMLICRSFWNDTFVSVLFISFITSSLGHQEEEDPQTTHPMFFYKGFSHSQYCALQDVKLVPDQSIWCVRSGDQTQFSNLSHMLKWQDDPVLSPPSSLWERSELSGIILFSAGSPYSPYSGFFNSLPIAFYGAT